MKHSIDPLEPTLHVELGELIEQNTFGDVVAKFHNLFGVPLRIFDTEGILLAEDTSINVACQYLNTLENSRSRCTVIRSKVKATYPPKIENSPQYIDCFCGLRYAITPLFFQAEIVGKLVVGPYLPAELNRIPSQLRELEPRVDPARIKDAMGAVRRLGKDTLTRLIEAINAVVDSLLFSAHKSYVTTQMHVATVRESYREITEKNRRLEELVDDQKEFERRKANFLSMVSHELRTPLTSIIGYSDMLAEGIAGELGDEQKQFVQTIKTKGEDLLNMISSILDFSLIDTGRLSLQQVSTDVRLLLEEAISPNKGTAERRGVHLSIETPADLPKIKMDPDKIRAAVRHLVDNAVKFSPPDGIVKVSATTVISDHEDGDEDGLGFVLMATPDMLEICVEDFGEGILENNHIEIFAPFTQIDESSTREHGGAGLGLAIVKHYTEAHGGRVSISSRLNEGSKFSIRIPIST